ncbi:MAG TPA: exodeoxyribonuclease III [Acidimicrobiales bacterium]|nr:exodeoxyribonuclease III [Acidimicrobiales bacterium]
MTLRVATWNVNSLKARLPRVEEWLGYAKPDVLCMQETKVADSAFPSMAFSALGYEAAYCGQGQWNGVAILSRVGLDDVVAGFSDQAEDEVVEARLLWATCGGVRVGSVYVPNGRRVGSEHYEAKLEWLDRLRRHVEATFDPSSELVICGDFNVAPDDRDVWDPTKLHGGTHISPPEREAVAALRRWGLVDVFRQQYEDTGLYSWWDYRAGDFHNHRGLRIDLVLATEPIARRATYALIDRFARKGKAPSDHAPLLVDFDR